MSFISDVEWAQYAADLSSFAGDSAQQSVTWKRFTGNLDRWGEGGNITYTLVTLKALVSYNHIRVWPINKADDVGIDDRQYCYLLINNTYLNNANYLNAAGVMKINRGYDRFIVNGENYRPVGDTPAAQEKRNPLFHIVILEKDVKSSEQGYI